MTSDRISGMGRATKASIWLATLFTIVAPLAYPSGAAHAQAIVLSVNGDPITTIDIEQRMKMLRVLRKPATREAAIESLTNEHLELHEASKFGVKVLDTDIGQEISRVAERLKTTPEALLAALQRGGVSQDQYKAHFRTDMAYSVLIQALNKGVEASEEQVRAELAKEAKTGGTTDFTVRQIIFTVPASASPAQLGARTHEAEQLRARFSSCESGVPVAEAMTDVVVRAPLTRSSGQMAAPLRALLDKTPTGHLTPPQRSVAGLEMVAVCSKNASKDDSALRATISAKILASKYEAEGARRLKDLRAHAVITRPNG